ncbi:MAG: TatD family hydrolase, partial [Firmicutes bacterium]|nr:TatD family hydrolase [Bacillota bacterium]
MRLFDSHCHITDEAFDENRDALIEQIRASSVALCTDVGSDLATSL